MAGLRPRLVPPRQHDPALIHMWSRLRRELKANCRSVMKEGGEACKRVSTAIARVASDLTTKLARSVVTQMEWVIFKK